MKEGQQRERIRLLQRLARLPGEASGTSGDTYVTESVEEFFTMFQREATRRD